MKFYNLFYIAIKDFLSNKKTYIHILVGFIISIVFLLISCSYLVSSSREINQHYNEYASVRQYKVDLSKYHGSFQSEFLSYSEVEDVSVRMKVPVWYDMQFLETVRPNGEVNTYSAVPTQLSIDESKLILNDTAYLGKNDYTYKFDDLEFSPDARLFSIPFDIEAVDASSTQITKNEITEYNQRFADHAIYKWGRNVQQKNEIVLSSYIVEKYGLTEEQVQDKNISFQIRPKSERQWYNYLQNYKVVGIIDENFYRISSRQTSPHIIITMENKAEYFWWQNGDFLNTIMPKRSGEYADDMELSYYISAKSNRSYDRLFSKLSAIRVRQFDKNEKEVIYAAKISDVSNSVTLYKEMARQQNFINYFILLLGVVIAIAVIINLINSMHYTILSNKKHYGILLSQGTSKKAVYCMSLVQIIVLLIIALTIGIIIAICVMLSIGSALKGLVFVQILWFDFMIITLCLTIILVLLCSIAAIIGNKIIFNSSVYDLIRGLK